MLECSSCVIIDTGNASYLALVPGRAEFISSSIRKSVFFSSDSGFGNRKARRSEVRPLVDDVQEC